MRVIKNVKKKALCLLFLYNLFFVIQTDNFQMSFLIQDRLKDLSVLCSVFTRLSFVSISTVINFSFSIFRPYSGLVWNVSKNNWIFPSSDRNTCSCYQYVINWPRITTHRVGGDSCHDSIQYLSIVLYNVRGCIGHLLGIISNQRKLSAWCMVVGPCRGRNSEGFRQQRFNSFSHSSAIFRVYFWNWIENFENDSFDTSTTASGL